MLIGQAWGLSDTQQFLRNLDGRAPTTTNLLAKIGALAYDLEVAATTSAAAAATTTPLECFQVAEPVLTPEGAGTTESCTVVLMDHDFANSYGSPYVGSYTPPSCDYDRVIINFTVEVAGRQYDRWGAVYLNDTQIFSTSTAEPTSYGIRWTYLKDVTPYLSLWKEPQTVIFQLDNIVNDVYTGILNSTLTATFFKSPVETGDHLPADLILPVAPSNSADGQGSFWTVPDESATATVSFPRNVNRAVFSVGVKGQGNEEFWWSNVPESAIHTFDSTAGTYPGYSPWREVQVFIDGQLAGVHWPFPVIYTGGVVPQLHRPIVGIDAFDLRDHEIDITPWLPLLCDGNAHTFDLKIVGLDDDGVSEASLSSTVESSWYVIGKVFLWLDDEGSITTGTIGSVSAGDPTIDFSQSITQNSTGSNETLDYSLSVARDFSITSLVSTQTQNGTATWTQSLSYSNLGGLYAYGSGGINTFETTGLDTATSPGVSYSTNYNYPLYCNTTTLYSAEGNLTLWAVLNQGLNLEVQGAAVYPTGLEAFAGNFTGSVLNTDRNGTANYSRYGDNTVTTGVGATDQTFYLGGLTGDGTFDTAGTELYYRTVTAYNNTVVSDYEVSAGEVTRDLS
ncbi:peptide N-acetyl-beta-D-glucosaminyl asparaginase amidase A-domain-containing protein [Xylariales sp. AK1849]|nr:peptide N-acetyl-beta-D-glucosaminyl asparaginase amidase A-domain-containing protein [Xylariales sp. AK1849]